MGTLRMSEKEAVERGLISPPTPPTPPPAPAPTTQPRIGNRDFTIVAAAIIGWLIGFAMGISAFPPGH